MSPPAEWRAPLILKGQLESRPTDTFTTLSLSFVRNLGVGHDTQNSDRCPSEVKHVRSQSVFEPTVQVHDCLLSHECFISQCGKNARVTKSEDHCFTLFDVHVRRKVPNPIDERLVHA